MEGFEGRKKCAEYRGEGRVFGFLGVCTGILLQRLHPTVKYFAVGKTAESKDRKASVLYSVEISERESPTAKHNSSFMYASLG